MIQLSKIAISIKIWLITQSWQGIDLQGRHTNNIDIDQYVWMQTCWLRSKNKAQWLPLQNHSTSLSHLLLQTASKLAKEELSQILILKNTSGRGVESAAVPLITTVTLARLTTIAE